jgi:hypothetical protein
MTSRIEVPPDNAATLATFQCDDPHRITGFAHLRKREPRSGRCPQLHAGSAAAAARRTSETLPFLLRSFGARRAGKLRQDASLAFLDVTALAFRISWRRRTA